MDTQDRREEKKPVAAKRKIAARGGTWDEAGGKGGKGIDTPLLELNLVPLCSRLSRDQLLQIANRVVLTAVWPENQRGWKP